MYNITRVCGRYISLSYPLAQYLLTQLLSAPASTEHANREPNRVRIHCVLRDFNRKSGLLGIWESRNRGTCGCGNIWDLGMWEYFGPGDLGVWQFANLGQRVWEHGNLEMSGCWSVGTLGMWEPGDLGIWEYVNLETWECTNLAIWECANVGMCLPDPHFRVRTSIVKHTCVMQMCVTFANADPTLLAVQHTNSDSHLYLCHAEVRHLFECGPHQARRPAYEKVWSSTPMSRRSVPSLLMRAPLQPQFRIRRHMVTHTLKENTRLQKVVPRASS